MNTHRIVLDVGQRHFYQNPIGGLHRAASESAIHAWRRRAAADAMEHSAYGLFNEYFGDGAPRTTPCLVTWRVAVGASSAVRVLRKVDNAIDATFGTCPTQRGRPAWESEGFLAHLGNLPLHGFTWIGAQLGAALSAFSDTSKPEASARGARLGAAVGGAVAWCWSQGLAIVGFAAKMLFRIPTTAYITVVQAFEPMDEQLRQDAAFGTASKLKEAFI